MTAPTIHPILTPDEHDRLHKAFKAISAEIPRCMNCNPLERTATAGGDTGEAP